MEHNVGTSFNFFDRAPALKERKTANASHTFINVGKEQFHVAAVALIDGVKHTPRVNDAVLKKILERFYSSFPKYIAHQAYLTPNERMSMLINSGRKSEVVACMAYVLRQLVVDEIYANPLKYRDAFDDLNKDTSKGFLRQSDSLLFASVFARALSQVLNATLSLSFVEHGKELRQHVTYGNDSANASKFELFLQVQGNDYYPAVKSESDYAFVGQLAVKQPQPVELTMQENDTIADMLDLIVTDNQRLLRVYSQWRQNILTMVQADNVSSADLINVYIKNLPYNPDGAETSRLFAKISKTEARPVTPGLLNKSKQINELLASTLAGWISTEQVDPDVLFEQIEKSTARTVSSAPAA